MAPHCAGGATPGPARPHKKGGSAAALFAIRQMATPSGAFGSTPPCYSGAATDEADAWAIF